MGDKTAQLRCHRDTNKFNSSKLAHELVRKAFLSLLLTPACFYFLSACTGNYSLEGIRKVGKVPILPTFCEKVNKAQVVGYLPTWVGNPTQPKRKVGKPGYLLFVWWDLAEIWWCIMCGNMSWSHEVIIFHDSRFMLSVPSILAKLCGPRKTTIMIA